MLSKTVATLIRRLNFGNTSRVLAFYSRRYGQIRLIAKGVRRHAKRRAGEVGPELFTEGELVFYPSRSDGLAVLKEWCEEDARPGIARKPVRYFAACYVAEVIEALSREGEPSAELYSLLAETLDAVAGASRCETILSAFELGLLRILGLAPETGLCTICGRKRDQARRGGILYSPVDGGAVCGECADRVEGPSVRLTAGALAAMEHLARTGPRSAVGVSLRPRELRPIREALSSSVACALERAPRTLRHAKTLEKARKDR